MNFKVGDFVRVINDDGYPITAVGSLGEVINNTGSGFLVVRFDTLVLKDPNFVGKLSRPYDFGIHNTDLVKIGGRYVPEEVIKCECGAEKVGHTRHSTWCCKYVKE